ncbi:peptidylprolyl isomerase [Stakelama flava]|uniref:peptidylprolyl isomerase n=1 Tax=Stakelama flava TaxID=2860338 RepID=UPI0031B9CCB1
MIKLTSKATRFSRVVLAMSGMVAATALSAQTVSDDQTPDAGLNLPKNLQIFGDVDPNVRKPTAIVNNSVITGTDVDHRLAMVASLNKMQVSADDRQQLKLQVLRSLIDETLQIQQAKANDITVSSDEIDQSYARIANRFNKTPKEFGDYLREIGSAPASLKRQIEGEIAWSRLLQRQVEPFVNVGDAEVNAILDRMKASKGAEEYHLKEIYLPSSDGSPEQVVAKMKDITEKLKQGVPFESLARTYSQATTSVRGGDLDWVRTDMLPTSMVEAVQNMQVGQIAGPVQVPGGYSLLYLVDQRQVLTADPRDAVLSLRQMTLNFGAGTSEAQAQAKAQALASAAKDLHGCGAVPGVAGKLGAEVVDNDSVRIRDLPPQLQDIMMKLKVGEATPPFGSMDQGVRVLVLCGRDDAKSAGLPSPDKVQAQLEQQRVNLRAQRMLRDLRRDAIIEYR